MKVENEVMSSFNACNNLIKYCKRIIFVKFVPRLLNEKSVNGENCIVIGMSIKQTRRKWWNNVLEILQGFECEVLDVTKKYIFYKIQLFNGSFSMITLPKKVEMMLIRNLLVIKDKEVVPHVKQEFVSEVF